MKTLITGSTGFVGRNLKEYFQPRYEDVFCPKRAELNLLDAEAVKLYMEKNAFDLVIHCGVTLLSVEENLKMYFNLERNSSAFGKMVCVGSGSEYGPGHYYPKMKEDYFGNHVPADIYGFSKFVMAKDVEAVRRNIYNLRVFGIYGKYENYKRRFISNNICRVLSGLNISIKKNVGFDYLYVNDFCAIAELFAKGSPLLRSYNVCAGQTVELLQLAKLVQKADGRERPIIVKEEGMGTEYSGDNSLYTSEFGAFPYTTHEKAVEELYGWYRDNLKDMDLNGI
ncbi:MAG: NAD-dependent dehydratase [Elusimicrobia bacterium CG08_land_8_20_14_0_20_51_18]|nr:MAG: NAD-dependent dehydratase [Elusimicrobia bacterium CG08_land_8_20_14_0_20_51_18]